MLASTIYVNLFKKIQELAVKTTVTALICKEAKLQVKQEQLDIDIY